MNDPCARLRRTRSRGYLRRTQYPPTTVSREFSGTVMALCFLGAALIVILAVVALKVQR